MECWVKWLIRRVYVYSWLIRLTLGWYDYPSQPLDPDSVLYYIPDSFKGIIRFLGNWILRFLKGTIQFPVSPGIGISSTFYTKTKSTTMSKNYVFRYTFYGKSYWFNENLGEIIMYTMYERTNINNWQLAT